MELSDQYTKTLDNYAEYLENTKHAFVTITTNHVDLSSFPKQPNHTLAEVFATQLILAITNNKTNLLKAERNIVATIKEIDRTCSHQTTSSNPSDFFITYIFPDTSTLIYNFTRRLWQLV